MSGQLDQPGVERFPLAQVHQRIRRRGDRPGCGVALAQLQIQGHGALDSLLVGQIIGCAQQRGGAGGCARAQRAAQRGVPDHAHARPALAKLLEPGAIRQRGVAQGSLGQRRVAYSRCSASASACCSSASASISSARATRVSRSSMLLASLDSLLHQRRPDGAAGGAEGRPGATARPR